MEQSMSQHLQKSERIQIQTLLEVGKSIDDIYLTNLKIPFGSPEMSHSLYQPLIEIFEAR